jgi:ABC-type polysaccharide/polyol phosphate export permease
VLPWLAFADTMVRSTNVILENSNLIKKIAFPSELLPVFVALAHMVHRCLKTSRRVVWGSTVSKRSTILSASAAADF